MPSICTQKATVGLHLTVPGMRILQLNIGLMWTPNLAVFYITVLVGLLISRWAIFQSPPNSHDNYVSWYHFKDKYITFHLKRCPKEVIQSRIGTYPLVPESD